MSSCLPHDYPRRKIIVKFPEPKLILVPSHITRIDIDGSSRTHGWQIRYGKPSVFINDGGESPAVSLEKAEKLLAEMNPVVIPRINNLGKGEKLEKWSQWKIRGDSFLWHCVVKTTKGLCRHYIETRIPGYEDRRFFIGTDVTMTIERVERAMELSRNHCAMVLTTIEMAEATDELKCRIAEALA